MAPSCGWYGTVARSAPAVPVTSRRAATRRCDQRPATTSPSAPPAKPRRAVVQASTPRRTRARAERTQFDDYVRQTAGGGTGGAAAEIERAKSLLDSGAITQSEFDAIKQKALA